MFYKSLNNTTKLFCKRSNSLGQYSKAEPLLSDALAMCDRILGVNHPTTVTIRENLAIVQRQLPPPAI
ncbi:tetratricopeptide repeat protein [Nostoc sp.]|uniref:tetratricopeptide repeat protein n=1 Tax=Nostoc sp. TaxID=1180 RepID=UPI002FF6667C